MNSNVFSLFALIARLGWMLRLASYHPSTQEHAIQHVSARPRGYDLRGMHHPAVGPTKQAFLVNRVTKLRPRRFSMNSTRPILTESIHVEYVDFAIVVENSIPAILLVTKIVPERNGGLRSLPAATAGL